jgi:thiamine-monophosphate kinase
MALRATSQSCAVLPTSRSEIEIDSVPLSEAARAALAKESGLLEIVLTGGDDYEVLATLPVANFPTFREVTSALGVLISKIGKVVEGAGDTRFLDRHNIPVTFAHLSYSHF